MIEPLDHLDSTRAGGQVDLERAGDVGVRVAAEDQAGAGVLEEPGLISSRWPSGGR